MNPFQRSNINDLCVCFAVEISFSLFQLGQGKISGGKALISTELRAWVKLTHEIIEWDNCNINKVKKRERKVIETSQTALIWLDGFCIISSKGGRSGQGMISIVLDILIFYFSGVIQQRWGRRGKKSFSWRQKNVRTDSKRSWRKRGGWRYSGWEADRRGGDKVVTSEQPDFIELISRNSSSSWCKLCPC